MRVSSRIVATLASAAVVGIGWQAGWAGITAQTGSSTTAGSTGGTTSDATGGTSTATASATDGAYTGAAVMTRFGTMQVQSVISGGQLTDVVVLQSTGPDRKSVQISNRAEPMLLQEVLASQSANVSGVSGATYTSRGYLQSLQSALDAAGFAG